MSDVTASRWPAILLLGLLLGGCSWHDPLTSPSTPTQPPNPSPVPPPVPGAPQVEFSGGPVVAELTPIALGDRIEGTVRTEDRACWSNWDATGRCRGYSLVVTEAGRLSARLTWATGELMDVFIVRDEGSSTVWDPNSNPTTIVGPRQTIWLVVMSYATPQNFLLETSFQP